MQLNHLDLPVSDVNAHARFFERYFGFVHVSNPASPAIVILSGEGGFTLVLQRKRDGEAYPDGFHCGFIVDDVAAVQATHARLVAGGEAVSDVVVNGRGTMIYCRRPDGILIEVSAHRRRDERQRKAPST